MAELDLTKTLTVRQARIMLNTPVDRLSATRLIVWRGRMIEEIFEGQLAFIIRSYNKLRMEISTANGFSMSLELPPT